MDETSPLPPHQWPTGDEDAGGPESTGSTSCPRRRAHVKKKAKPSDGRVGRCGQRTADRRPPRAHGSGREDKGGRRASRQRVFRCVRGARGIWAGDLVPTAEAGDQVPDRPQPRGPMDGIRSAIRPALSLWRWLAGPGGKGRNNQGKQNPAWPSRRVLLQPVQCRRRTTAGGCWRSATDGKFWEPQASGPGPYILVLLSLS